MDLRGRRVLVVGLAQTGISVARFCARRGARVVVNDGKPEEALGERIAALRAALAEVPGAPEPELALGGHPEALFTGADLVVMSPGVPEMPAMAAARAAGVEVIAEIELAHRFLHPEATLIAITGTNGKSTTTALCGALCQASGRPTFCGGNLGNHPLIDAVDHPASSAGGLVVAEVAGFMLETCAGFRPRVAACLNITEDHLDRYGTMEVYASMKTRVYRWQEEGDAAIGNGACPLTMEGARRGRGRLFVFDSRPEAERGPIAQGAWLSDDRAQILLRLAGSGPGAAVERYPVSDLVIVGNHNMENAMAAYLCARLAGVEPDAIRRGARAFRPQKHRMELVGRLGEIVFYDDSKGTNVAAVAASVRGFPRPLVLIAGGVDKGGSYQPMFEALDGVARGLVLIGEAAPLIRAAAAAHGAAYPVIDATDMHDAVRRAVELARPGDAVVLSPACASYDMFRNFGHRGAVFREALGAAGAERLD
ncbi:MAG TPA: UDP-N-acetylmuramoyl-L-alanine--D-glutamate ligase [Kofleriaceae bacterium]|nr:UDP-N-acetylmuramoyl-L-alanine--D-glutamate ligase [Kofleriaceae bacterium]